MGRAASGGGERGETATVARDTVFAAVIIVTNGRGSSTALQGLIHLVLLGAFLALSFVP